MNDLKPKYDIVVFDFDNTLCNMNINIMGITVKDINERDKTVNLNDSYKTINTLINDYNEILEIFTDLKKKGVKLCIASFGDSVVIEKILSIAFPGLFDYILASDNIDKESNDGFVMKIFRHIVDPICPRFYGKNIMLRTIVNKYNVYNNNSILFLDDDYSNAACSGYMNVKYFNNAKHGITAKLLKELIYGIQDGGNPDRQFIRYVRKNT